MIKSWQYRVIKEHGNVYIGTPVIKKYGVDTVEEEMSKKLGCKVVIEGKLHQRDAEVGTICTKFSKKNLKEINFIATIVS